MGPRGLTVLERIVANERVRKSADIEIFVFDPHPPGVGCHDPEQEDYLLVNTVAGQITQFSDASVVGAGPILEGPSFYQWLEEQRGTKLGGRWSSQAISPDHYYSRALFGRYLYWVYHYLAALAPSHVQINLVQESILDADRLAEDSWVISTKSGSFCVNYLFLTTGHTKPAGNAAPALNTTAEATRVIDDPYPIKTTTSAITADMTVAIEGMGLTMFDVLGALTTGRGGRFIRDEDGRMRYLPSGQEPRLVAYSRSGLPLTARAVNQKGVSIQYKARFLLADKVRSMRAGRKLDFVTDIFPLLLADMQFAYYEAYLRERRDPVTSMLFCNQFVCADVAEREALISQYVPEADRFSWDRLVNPLPDDALATPEDFHEWLMEHLRQDLREAYRGNVQGPLKAACDVVRDLRDNLRAAIDHGGLTEASHRWLLSEFVPIMNRIAVGPPSSRIAELLALVEAGVLEMSHGPGAACKPAQPGERMRVVSKYWPDKSTEVDVLIKARVSMHSPAEDSSPLLRSLLKGGYLRLFHNGSFHPGGIEVTREFNWVTASGQAIDNAWALGIPTEGVKFYTFVVPRSGVNSTAIVDAGRAVSKMISMITGHAPATHDEANDAPVPTTEYASAFASLYGALS
ncbi:MAG TPA: FAD/NAD(P)-binding protein [Rhizobacter sp.]